MKGAAKQIVEFNQDTIRVAEIECLLPGKDLALLQTMMQGFWRRHVGAKRYEPSSVSAVLGSVLDMVRFTRRAPWYWTEEDFDDWCYDIYVHRRDGKPGCLAGASQRKHQVNIKVFLEFVGTVPSYVNEVFGAFGVRPRQIVHKWNMVEHTVEHDTNEVRQALDREQMEHFFNTIDEMTFEAHFTRSKSYMPLRRDKAMFATIYHYGIRRSEAASADKCGFERNEALPLFKGFGSLWVLGKGSKGSGKRPRQVPLTDENLVPVIEDYLKHVRPVLAKKADPFEEALFLSERGNRICPGSINSRFSVIATRAGFDPGKYCVHSLRHSSVSHEATRFSTATNQAKHGHKYASTTQGYTHIPDKFVEEEIARVTIR